MRDLLGKVFRKAVALLGSDERKWQAQFVASADQLKKLADQVLAEYAAGETELLDRNKL